MLQEDYIGLQKYCICAGADYLSQRAMKCESDDAMYSLQSLQMILEIKELVRVNIKKDHKNFPVTRDSILKICNLPCNSKENMRSR